MLRYILMSLVGLIVMWAGLYAGFIHPPFSYGLFFGSLFFIGLLPAVSYATGYKHGSPQTRKPVPPAQPYVDTGRRERKRRFWQRDNYETRDP